MKLDELLKESTIKNENDEYDWLWQMTTTSGSISGWTKSAKGWSYPGNVSINNYFALPVKLNRIDNLVIYGSKIESLNNFPESVDSLLIEDCNVLSDFSLLPRCRSLTIKHCNKLENLAEQLLRHLKGPLDSLYVEGSVTDLTGMDKVTQVIKQIRFKDLAVRKGGVGLLAIPGQEKLNIQMMSMGDFEAHQAACVIEEYAGRPNDIFDCQSKLIDEGLEQFAEL